MALWKWSKRTSSQSTHCGFQSWSSPEGFQDKVYEKTSVTPEECLKAVKQHLWIDPHGDVHQVKEGHKREQGPAERDLFAFLTEVHDQVTEGHQREQQ